MLWSVRIFCALTIWLLAVEPASARFQFIAGTPFTVSRSPLFAAVGDFNDDGIDDLAVTSPGNREVSILLGRGDASFILATVQRFGRQLGQLAAADVNQDRLDDVVVTDSGAQGVWILLGNGTGTVSTPFLVRVGTRAGAEGVAVGDFDGINGNDLAVTDDRADRVIILLNDGRGAFRRSGDFPVGRRPKDLVVGDFDGDGLLDLTALNTGGPLVKDVTVLLGERVAGIPVFRRFANVVVGERAQNLIAADLNGDDLPDLAMINRKSAAAVSQIEMLLARGDGLFEVGVPVPVSCPVTTAGLTCLSRAIGAADLDRNGTIDLAVVLNDPREGVLQDALSVFSGIGGGRFVPGITVETIMNPRVLSIGDFTGDGLVDIAVGTTTNSTVQIFQNLSEPSGTREPGAPCLSGNECLSGFCINGVCCNRQCRGAERCDVRGREGFCTEAGQLGPGDACDEDAQCAADFFCTDGVCCLLRACPPGEFCAPPDGLCEPLREDGDPCQNDAQCASGFCVDGVCCAEPFCPANQFCAPPAGVCRGKKDAGEACTSRVECLSGFCTDGVCCVQELCPPGLTCRAPDGLCRPGVAPTATPGGKANGVPCASGAECRSGFCTNGVCCQTGLCPSGQRCDVSGFEGTCAPVSLTPTTPGTPPAATPTGTPPTVTPTRIPDRSPTIARPTIIVRRSGGCAIGAGTALGGADALLIGLFPAAAWLRRRWRRAARTRAGG